MAVICDFSVLTYRMIFGALDDIIDNPKYLSHMVMTGIFDIVKRFKVNDKNPLVIAVDCPRGDIWRQDVFKEGIKNFPEYAEKNISSYKQRDSDVRVPWTEVKALMADMIDFFDEFTDFQVVKHPTAEADDCIKIITDYYRRIGKVTIISTDKDFNQLLDYGGMVSLYDPRENKYRKIEDNYLAKQIMTGDKIDSILSCDKRLGPKTAEKILPDLKKRLDEDSEFKKRFYFNSKMIDLARIPTDIEDTIKVSISKNFRHFSWFDARDYFVTNHLANAFGDIRLLKLKQTTSTNALY